MGDGEKFDNQEIKQVHDISTKVVTQTKLSIHENVVEFNEDWF